MGVLNAIVAFSLKQRVLVLVGAVALLIAGVESSINLKIDAVPDVTNAQVQIITAAPALSPVEVEQYVSSAVERAMAGMPHVTEIRSLSKYGISVVTVVFTDETSLYLARQLVVERMADVQSAVPGMYGRPELGPMSTALGEVFQFVLEGEGHSLMELRETLDWYIGPQLRTVPGVVETLVFGGDEKQYQVLVDPTRLSASGLGLQDVVNAVEASNANSGGGYVLRQQEQILVSAQGLVRSPAELEAVVIGVGAKGVPITIGHIGSVRIAPKLKRGSATMNGRGEIVVATTLMLTHENSRLVTAAIKNKIAALEPTLPKGMRIVPFYDRSELVEHTIRTVLKNLAEGAGLVILVLLVLLGNLRAGFIVALTIPLAMSFAVIIMRAADLSGNLMSLGALDFGLLVDAAVIIVENSLRRLGEANGGDRVATVREATLEVRAASVFGEAIIAIVYVPILSLRGLEGKLFTPMATTVLLALAGAFIASLTVVPVLSSLLLDARSHSETAVFRFAHRLYVPLLSRAMKHTAATAGVGVAALALGVVCLVSIGSEFVPRLDEGDVLVEARRLPGVSLDEAIAGDTRMQKALITIPEIEVAVSKNGAPDLAIDPMGVDQSDVYLRIKPRDEWREGLSKDELEAEMARVLDDAAPDIATSISQPIEMRTNELVAGIRYDVAALVYGPELETLQRLAQDVALAVELVEGASSVHVDQGVDIPYLRVLPDRQKLARYGLRIADVNLATEAMAVGHPTGIVFEGERRFSLAVKMALPHEQSNALSLDTLRALPLRAPSTGQVVPLGDVAVLEETHGPAAINREHQSRRMVVEWNVRGRDTGSVVADAKRAVAARVTLPDGYRIEWGGQFRHYEEAKNRLMVVVPLCLLLIFAVLWFAFGAVKPALLILTNVPFAVVGGAVALALRGIPFSISAGVGFIALFGVSVLNGLVLVAFARHLELGHVPPREAIRRAAEMRLRPVLMTAAVATLGFVPMALSTAPGSEVQRPLATVVIGGLTSAAALTLLLFPVLYAAAHRRA